MDFFEPLLDFKKAALEVVFSPFLGPKTTHHPTEDGDCQLTAAEDSCS